jgi:uncharacterized protein
MPGDVFRTGGISYLHIPAPDPTSSAVFYRETFGWNVRDDPDSPAFEDGTGHVIGHFIRDLPVSGEAGVTPYVFVDDIDQTLELIAKGGGKVLRDPYPEGSLWVATFLDPAGNVVGIWQNGPRRL